MDIELGVEVAIATLAAAMIFGALAWAVLNLYIANLRLAEVLEHLPNSPLVDAHRYCLDLGIRWRFRAISDIAGLLTYPDCPVEFGGLSAKDVKDFPTSLKTLLILTHRLKLALLSVMMLLAITLQILNAIQYQGQLMEIHVGESLAFRYSPHWMPLALQLLCLTCIVWVGHTYAKAGMRYMNSASRYLSNCRAVVNRQRPVMYNTVFGRIVFTVCIAALLAHSKLFIKTGSLQAAEVKTFPAKLKAELVVNHYLCLASVVGLSASYVATKLIN